MPPPHESHHLPAEVIAGTGLAGRPEEYFWRDDEPYWSQRWGVEGFTDALRAAIAQGTTPNGVFGAKVMFGYLPDLLGKLAALPGNQGLGDRILLERAFPNLRYVWIWREDVVAQAVSWSKAIQTGVWYQQDARRTAIAPPRFDFQQVHGLARQAIADRVGWQRWFGPSGSSRSGSATRRWSPTWWAPPGGCWASLGSCHPRISGSLPGPPDRPMRSTSSGRRATGSCWPPDSAGERARVGHCLALAATCSGVLIHKNGWQCSFQASMKIRIARIRSATLVKLPRRIALRVMIPKKISTRFSQLVEILWSSVT
jgi:hypothetical protein